MVVWRTGYPGGPLHYNLPKLLLLVVYTFAYPISDAFCNPVGNARDAYDDAHPEPAAGCCGRSAPERA